MHVKDNRLRIEPELTLNDGKPVRKWYVTRYEYRPALEYYNGRLITKLVKTKLWASRER